MIREQTLRARQKLVSKLPVSGELLRGSLLERTVRHTKKCARGEGHHVFVLSVTYMPAYPVANILLTTWGHGHGCRNRRLGYFPAQNWCFSELWSVAWAMRARRRHGVGH